MRLFELTTKHWGEMNSKGFHRWWSWRSWSRRVHRIHGMPRWYDLLKRHMVQTNKSTPLPHNSLSLHVFSSSSCCHQDYTQPHMCPHTYTDTHTNPTTARSVSSVVRFVHMWYLSLNCAVLYEFNMYCKKYISQYHFVVFSVCLLSVVIVIQIVIISMLSPCQPIVFNP